MRIAILYAPGDEDFAERKRAALGAADALIAPLASSLAFGEQLVLLVLWTDAARAHLDQVCDLAERRGGVVVLRADGTPTPAALEHVSLDADSSARAVASALRLAEMERSRDPQHMERPRRRGGAVLAAAGGVVAVLTLGAAGAAAFMLDGQDPLSVLAVRETQAVQPGDDLRPAFEDASN